LRVKAQLLERLQRVNVADGATHFPKDGTETPRGGYLRPRMDMFFAIRKG
jgi:hypothetical protein